MVAEILDARIFRAAAEHDRVCGNMHMFFRSFVVIFGYFGSIEFPSVLACFCSRSFIAIAPQVQIVESVSLYLRLIGLCAPRSAIFCRDFWRVLIYRISQCFGLNLLSIIYRDCAASPNC